MELFVFLSQLVGRDGKPQFFSLMRRRSPQHFCAFDLLWLNGRDLRELPLLERKRLLRDIIPAQGCCPVRYVGHVAERGVDLFNAVCSQDLEGIVAKRANGLYIPDETSWVKVKNRNYSQNVGRWEWFANAKNSRNSDAPRQQRRRINLFENSRARA